MDNIKFLPINEASPDIPGMKDEHNIVSRVAFLIGASEVEVVEKYGLSGAGAFNELSSDPAAKAVRNLCILRTIIIKNFSTLSCSVNNKNNSYTMVDFPGVIPSDVVNELRESGLEIDKYVESPKRFLVYLNECILDNLKCCNDLFPLWLNFGYVVKLISVPEEPVESKKATQRFSINKKRYPFGMYIYVKSVSEVKNLFENDYDFISAIYSSNGGDMSEAFGDHSAGKPEELFSFLEDNKGCVVIVDCENADPYLLCSALNSIQPKLRKRISKVVLYDDVHTSSAWELLGDHVPFPVEYVMIERLRENKSLADVKISSRMCLEYFKNKCRAFILVSSDSDYWGVIEDLTGAHFLVLVDKEKCGDAFINALTEQGMGYCYVNAFSTDKELDALKCADALRYGVIENELMMIFPSCLSLSLNYVLNRAMENARIKMDEGWKRDYLDNELQPRLKLKFTNDRKVELALKQVRKK